MINDQWIKTLLKSFKKMSQTDQQEYLTLHDKFDLLQPNQYLHKEDFLMITRLKLEIAKFEKDQEKAFRIHKICTCIRFA